MPLVTTTDHKEREHALCGASGAERWLACPGSVAMELKAPGSEEESIYAAEGTQFHELIDKICAPIFAHYNLNGNNSLPQKFNVNVNASGDEESFQPYPREMQEHAIETIKVLFRAIKKYKPKKVFIEKKVYLNEPMAMFGTVDFFFAFKHGNKTVLFLLDIKYGKGKVVEPSSPQLIYYALAVQKTYPKIKFQEFWLHIWQPRAEHDEGPLRQYVMKRKEASNWMNTFAEGAVKAMGMAASGFKGELELTPGDHCGYCSAKAMCNPYLSYLNGKAGDDFLEAPEDLNPTVMYGTRFDANGKEIVSAQHVLAISDEKIIKLLKYKGAITKFLNALTEYGINRFREGNPIPGTKVVEGRSQRKWLSNETKVAEGLTVLGIEDPYDKSLRGLGSIERELQQLGMKGKEERAEAISHLTTRTTPSLTLTLEDDARAAITNSGTAKYDFNDDLADSTT